MKKEILLAVHIFQYETKLFDLKGEHYKRQFILHSSLSIK